MAHDEKTLSLEPGTWGEDAAQWLAQAGTAAEVEDYRRDVQRGAASLFRVKQGEQIAGAFLLRVDRYTTGADGVIVAAAAHIEGLDAMAAFLPHIEAMFRGVDRIRIHTGKPAVARKLARHGYQAREIVSIKDMRHGQ